MYKYYLTFDAEKDIDRIFDYGLGQFGISQALKYYDMIFQSFDEIARNPYMFPTVQRLRNVERYSVCGVDTIFFNVVGNEIEIVAIIGRQNFQDAHGHTVFQCLKQPNHNGKL